MIAAALTSSAVDFEDYSPSFQSGSNTCICIIHRSMTDRILHSSAQKIESAAAYRLNRAEIIGNGFFLLLERSEQISERKSLSCIHFQNSELIRFVN